MNERISRVLKKVEEKGITQLIVSDPLSIRFLTGIMVNPGEKIICPDPSYKRKAHNAFKLSVLCKRYRL